MLYASFHYSLYTVVNNTYFTWFLYVSCYTYTVFHLILTLYCLIFNLHCSTPWAVSYIIYPTLLHPLLCAVLRRFHSSLLCTPYCAIYNPPCWNQYTVLYTILHTATITEPLWADMLLTAYCLHMGSVHAGQLIQAPLLVFSRLFRCFCNTLPSRWTPKTCQQRYLTYPGCKP